MGHIVLLGDSIFDNQRYVPTGTAVEDKLRKWLGAEWQVTLLAVDGSVVDDVPKQVERLPSDATHVVVSVGGNDALENSGLLHETKGSPAEVFVEFAAVQKRFRDSYRVMLEGLAAAARPTVICTVYDAIPDLGAAEATGLSIFNDVILREAFRHGLPVVDLRLVCDKVGDYSPVSPIEPSQAGGEKIARAIQRVVTSHDFGRGESVVYGR
jgi:lysophospholipase L1-like esterase